MFLGKRLGFLPHLLCSPVVQRWPWQDHDLEKEREETVFYIKYFKQDWGKNNILPATLSVWLSKWNFTQLWPLLTADRSPRWSRSGRSAVRLSFATTQDGTSKYCLQFFGIWRRDGVASDGHLHKGEPHAPHIWLHRIVGSLQSLRLSSKHTAK